MSDATLVIGGGAAGVTAALDLAQSGERVILVEKTAILGGVVRPALAETSETPPTANRPDPPTIAQATECANLEIHTLAEMVELAGKAGRFTATIRQRARFVTDACTQCNRCRLVCPVVSPNEYEAGLTFRKAIYRPYKESAPKSYLIDADQCLNKPPNYIPCQRCTEVCEGKCIDFEMQPEQTFTREISSVIVAVGYGLDGPVSLPGCGYGVHPDIVTSSELECLLTSTGPTGGFVAKPSDEESPEKVLFFVSDGSRFTWTYTARHAERMAAQDINDVTVLYRDKKARGAGLSVFWDATGAAGARLVHGSIEMVRPSTGNRLDVKWRDLAQDSVIAEEFDMVVLATAVRPPDGLPELAATLGIELGVDGFVLRTSGRPDSSTTTTREGVYVAGCASGPKNIPESVGEGRAAALRARRSNGKPPA